MQNSLHKNKDLGGKKKTVPLDFRDRQSPIPHRLSVECLLKSQGEERG